MRWKVEFTPRAYEELKALPKKTQRRIANKIDGLEENPRPRQAKKLQGMENLYRLRSGDYRILYRIDDEAILVLVVRIGHRREVYRRKP